MLYVNDEQLSNSVTAECSHKPKSRQNECMDKQKMLRLPFSRPYFSITNLKDSSVQAELDDNIIICISSPYVEVRL